MPKEESLMKELTPDQLERLWQHKDTLLNGFLHFVNYLLVSESILMAMVGMLSSSERDTYNIQVAVICLGISITLLWTYIQGKQKFILDYVRKECEKHMDEFSFLMEKRRSSLWKISNTWLLAYFLPFLFLITWVLIFIFLHFSSK